MRNFKDLRLNEFKEYPKDKHQARIRIGFYSMMKRSGYDIYSVSGIVAHDTEYCVSILQGKNFFLVISDVVRLGCRWGIGIRV